MMQDSSAQITERRRMTRNRMYRFIYDADHPVSKQELAARLGYSLPTVHQNIAELMEGSYIKPGQVLKSTGGRPAIGYCANSGLRFSVGISVSANQVQYLVSDLMQNEVAYKKVVRTYSADEMPIALHNDLEDFLDENEIDPKRVLGVGITFPGIIDKDKDVIELSPTLRSRDVNLSAIREAIPYPLYFENDSTSAGNAEWLSLPLSERSDDFVYLFLENGVGGAIFVNGKPYQGAHRKSAEFGHMTVEPDGRECHCGRRGCLEAYCSALRFQKDLGMDVDTFFHELEAGNEDCKALWDDYLCHLAVAIHNLRMAFDCRVILGGFMCTYLEPHMDRLRGLVAGLSPFGESADFLQIGRYPTKAVMMGSAWKFVDEFITKI